jgi:hypothetical protein
MQKSKEKIVKMFTFTAIFGILGTMKKRCTGLPFFFMGSEILHDDIDRNFRRVLSHGGQYFFNFFVENKEKL